MISRFSWKKWGVYFGVARLTLGELLYKFHLFYIERIFGTVWDRALRFVEYPARLVSVRVIRHLNLVPPPRMYDVYIETTPSVEAAALIEHMIGSIIIFSWWFLLGAIFAIAVSKFRGPR